MAGSEIYGLGPRLRQALGAGVRSQRGAASEAERPLIGIGGEAIKAPGTAAAIPNVPSVAKRSSIRLQAPPYGSLALKIRDWRVENCLPYEKDRVSRQEKAISRHGRSVKGFNINATTATANKCQLTKQSTIERPAQLRSPPLSASRMSRQNFPVRLFFQDLEYLALSESVFAYVPGWNICLRGTVHSVGDAER
jgi:hypothetical protein